MKRRSFFSALFISLAISAYCQNTKPLRIGIAGLTHDHVGGLLSRAHDSDIQIVGVAESNRELAEKYFKKYDLPLSLLYPSLEEMLDKMQTRSSLCIQ